MVASLALLLSVACSVQAVGDILRPLEVADCFPATLPSLPFGTQSYGQVSLLVKEARWDVDGQLSFNTRAYYYNQKPMFPGPLIRMKPGTQCQIRLVNAFPQAGEATCLSQIAAQVRGEISNFMCADAMNLHTHGLHVAPQQDDVSIMVFPGQEHVYTYDIIPDHLMGTHWYHPHTHGATALQLGGGMVGMLHMLPSYDAWAAMPTDIKTLYDDSYPYSFNMVLFHVFFGDGDAVLGDMSMRSFPQVWEMTGPQQIVPDAVINTPTPSFYIVNGQYQPVIELPAGNVGLLRIVHATGFRQIVLKFATPGICQMRLLARDGVFQQEGYPYITRMVLVPATRADIAVICKPPSTAVFPMDVVVYADDQDIGPLQGNCHAQSNVFTVRIPSPAESVVLRPVTTFPVSNVALPSYLSDLRGQRPVWSKIVDLDQFAINGVHFRGFDAPLNERYIYSMCLNTVYDFWLTSYDNRLNDDGDIDPALELNATARRRLAMAESDDIGYVMWAGQHPFHMHTNAMQVIQTMEDVPVEVDFVRSGEWRDTCPELNNGVQLRFKPDLFAGEVVVHCHFLEHEDRGMMGIMNVSQC